MHRSVTALARSRRTSRLASVALRLLFARPAFWSLGALFAVVGLGGCAASELDLCDPEVAAEVVYEPNTGAPAYVGQALMLRSCGGGQFCHSSTADGIDRHGVPRGLDFDVQIASIDASANVEKVVVLRHGRFRVRQQREDIWRTVQDGSMPPTSTEAQEVLVESLQYASITGDPLPPLDSPAGREALRNWLACDSPVIERTVAQPGVPSVTVSGLGELEVAASWDSIFEDLLVNRCASAVCHGGEPTAGFRIYKLDREATRAQLFLPASTATRDGCAGQGPLVDLSQPEAESLFVRKLAQSSDELCGDRMPRDTVPVGAENIENIREWIRMGALP